MFVQSFCFFLSIIQEDYIETDEKKLVPLRWTAPELITSFQDRLLSAEQNKYSNIWYVVNNSLREILEYIFKCYIKE